MGVVEVEMERSYESPVSSLLSQRLLSWLAKFLLAISLLILLLGVATLCLDDWRYRESHFDGNDGLFDRYENSLGAGVWAGAVAFFACFLGLIAVHAADSKIGRCLWIVFAILLLIAMILIMVMMVISGLAVDRERSRMGNLYSGRRGFVELGRVQDGLDNAEWRRLVRLQSLDSGHFSYFAHSVLALDVLHCLLITLGVAFLAGAVLLFCLLVADCLRRKRRSKNITVRGASTDSRHSHTRDIPLRTSRDEPVPVTTVRETTVVTN